MRDLLELARPAQWIKNVFVLAPLIFSQRFFRSGELLSALIAFAAFCLASSASYVLNDVIDRDRDRGHLDHRAEDPDLAGREAPEQPEDEDAPGGDDAEQDEEHLDPGHRLEEQQQHGGGERHQPEAHPRQLAFLGAHPSLELALELL